MLRDAFSPVSECSRLFSGEVYILGFFQSSRVLHDVIGVAPFEPMQ